MNSIRQNSSELLKLKPVIVNCSDVKAGKTTVGNIASDEPTTIPSIK